MDNFLFSIFVVIVLAATCNCAKILVIFPSPFYGNYVMGEKLVLELVKRGHDVTFVAPYAPNKKFRNLKVIKVVELSRNDSTFRNENLVTVSSDFTIFNMQYMAGHGIVVSNRLFTDPKFMEYLSYRTRCDLVILDYFFNEAHMAIASYYKAPLILFSSLGMNQWISNYIGNLHMPSIHANSFFADTNNIKSIRQRAMANLQNLIDWIYFSLHTYGRHLHIVNTYLPEIENNLFEHTIHNPSLVLLNSDVAVNGPRHMTQAAIEIGGFHIKKKKLSEDYRHMIDNYRGIVLFSLGCNINYDHIDSTQLRDIVEALKIVPNDFLIIWKYDRNKITQPELENLPSNFYITNWVPQIDLLADPKMVLFITNGGLPSLTEAIYFGIPILALPIYNDQISNMAKCVEFEMCEFIEFSYVTEENLKSLILKMLNATSYKINALKRSVIIKDKPVHPMDLAMFWIEYVLTYKNLEHLQNPVIHLTAIERYGLQVCFVNLFLASIFAWLYALYEIFYAKWKSYRTPVPKKRPQPRMRRLEQVHVARYMQIRKRRNR